MQKHIGLITGPLIACCMLLIEPPNSLNTAAWHTAAIALWMAIWWATETVPVAITALLPLVTFAVLDISTAKMAAAPYSHPIIYLFLGGFIIASGIQKVKLHQRIAFFILRFANLSAGSLIFCFMFVAAFLSMWMTNTSTTIMLVPVVMSIVTTIEQTGSQLSKTESTNFQLCLLLGVAYAATIGGMATLVGTPPNALLAAFINEQYGIEIGFAKWMLIGLPIAIIMLPVCWAVLTRLVYPVSFKLSEDATKTLEEQRQQLGPMTSSEKQVGFLFLCVIAGWVLRPAITTIFDLQGLTDTAIAIAGVIALFLLPQKTPNNTSSNRLMEWDDLKNVPWNVVILFGGGLSLAAAVADTGLANWLGQSLANFNQFGPIILILGAAALVIFLTEMTSNLATTAAFLPVMAAISLQIGGAPLLLTVPVTLAASCAFMLPVATPPNAIAFSSGRISIPQMAKAGFTLNIIGIFIVSAVSVLLVPMVFGS